MTGSHDIAEGMLHSGMFVPGSAGFYVVQEHIGSGGFSHVYKALAVPANIFDAGKKENFAAIKILRPEFCTGQPECAAAKQAFNEEPLKISDLDHPNVVDVLDCGTLSNGVPYYVMEYLENTLAYASLDDRLVKDYLVQMPSFLKHMEKNGLLHFDLKPTNICLAPWAGLQRLFRKGSQIKIIDFGSMVSRDDPDGAGLYSTEKFAPPEYRAEKTVHPSFDIYCTGATLKALLTGAHLADRRMPSTEEMVGYVQDVFSTVLPGSLVDIVEGTTHDDPGMRPSPERLGKMVAQYVRDTRNRTLFREDRRDLPWLDNDPVPYPAELLGDTSRIVSGQFTTTAELDDAVYVTKTSG